MFAMGIHLLGVLPEAHLEALVAWQKGPQVGKQPVFVVSFPHCRTGGRLLLALMEEVEAAMSIRFEVVRQLEDDFRGAGYPLVGDQIPAKPSGQ
jgi:hypothetical protein